MGKIKINSKDNQVRAMFQPSSFDEENRTVEVVWSTGAKGKRYSWSGSYLEELSMKKDDIRMDRLNQGAPFLNQHNSYTLGANLGVVERAWIKDKKGHALIRLSSRDEIQGIVQDIKDGILRNISVGYKIHKLEDVTKKNDEIPTYRATDWEPLEISLVNVPFDKDAQVRSDIDGDGDGFIEIEIESLTREDNNLESLNNIVVENAESVDNNSSEVERSEGSNVANDNNIINFRQEATMPEEVKKQQEDAIRLAKESEKARSFGIKEAVRNAGLDESIADEMIANDVELDAARAQVIAKLGEQRSANPTASAIVAVGDDNRRARMEGAVNALIHRSNSFEDFKLDDAGKEFRNMSLLEVAKETLSQSGVNVRNMSKNEIAERALHSTSDFVEILANTANKTLRMAYSEQAQSFDPFTKRIQVPDFKEISRAQVGDAPGLVKVGENGEIKSGKILESAEKYRVETYARMVGITRQTLVNDDLNAFVNLPASYGRRSRQLESLLIYTELMSNPLMGDGNALFSAAHGNIATGANIGTISVDTVSVMRKAMRLQTGLDKDLLIRLSPKFLLTPAELETAAEQFLGPIVAVDNAKVNPFTGKMQNITDGLLDSSATPKGWYGLASKDQIDMFELATLEGEMGPRLSTKDGFNVEGVQFKVVYDIGVKAIDWRGMYFNPNNV